MDRREPLAGYTILRRLGSDASAMFLARHDPSGRRVTLRFVDVSGPSVRDRLFAAAPRLRAVDHPHVVQFLDVVDGPSGAVVVLGPAEGGSLSGIIGARGLLPAGEVVTACAPVAEGLTEIHRYGLVHGDLTLDDIVFTLDGRPMVAGVGLVQAGVPLRGGQFARPVPPEVQAGSPPGPPADIHGLVSAAVVALTGYLPSARLSLPGVSPAAQALLASALDPNPSRRPTAANVGNAFFALADPAPVELILEDGHATTGSLPAVTPDEPVDDLAAYMQRSTSAGRRARRRAEGGAAPAPVDAGPAVPLEQRVTREIPPAVPQEAAPPREQEAGAAAAPSRAPRRGRRPPPSGLEAAEPRPTPLAAPPGDEDEAAGTGRRRADGIWIVSTLVALLLVAGAVIVGMQFFGNDEPTTGPGDGSSPSDTEASTDLCGGPQPAPTTPPPAVADWTQEVQRLYSLRAQAFQEGNAELLCQVHAPSNPVLAEDARLLQEYADAGVHADGLVFEVVNAELVAQDGGRVTVSITQRIPDYRLVNEDGEVEQEIDGNPERTWEAELVAVADEGAATSSWRFG